MQNGDISNLSSPQVICVAEVVSPLVVEETRKLLSKKTEHKLGELNLLGLNKLWLTSNKYGLSLEMAAFESEGWTEELLDKAFEKFDRRVVNPFNYWQLYEDVEELVGMLPYRPNLKGVVDIQARIARYGSAGVELNNL